MCEGYVMIIVVAVCVWLNLKSSQACVFVQAK
jgi:hypothetical protein